MDTLENFSIEEIQYRYFVDLYVIEENFRNFKNSTLLYDKNIEYERQHAEIVCLFNTFFIWQSKKILRSKAFCFYCSTQIFFWSFSYKISKKNIYRLCY